MSGDAPFDNLTFLKNNKIKWWTLLHVECIWLNRAINLFFISPIFHVSCVIISNMYVNLVEGEFLLVLDNQMKNEMGMCSDI